MNQKDKENLSGKERIRKRQEGVELRRGAGGGSPKKLGGTSFRKRGKQTGAGNGTGPWEDESCAGVRGETTEKQTKGKMTKGSKRFVTGAGKRTLGSNAAGWENTKKMARRDKEKHLS